MIMKKYIFLVSLIMVNYLSAQDTIPFMDPCFCYPAQGEMGPHNSTCLKTYHYPPEFIHNDFYIENVVHSKDGNSVKVYGIAITSDSTLPAELSVVLYREPIYRRGVQPIDSLNCSDACYHKKMYYNYTWRNIHYNTTDTSTHSATAPCHVYLFNYPVLVPDTFLYKTTAIDQSFSLRELSCLADSSHGTVVNGHPVTNGWGGRSHYYFEGYNQCGIYSFYTWGGIFPILSLPCPQTAKPVLTESMPGSVRFVWPEGDTNLYQVAICAYPDTTLLYRSDTLVDSTFHITDSLMTAIGLPEGRYYIRLARACNYKDSPFDTLLWSPWSDAGMLYYVPTPVGIAAPDRWAPLFSLSPNPATEMVTVKMETPPSLFSPGETKLQLQIVDMEGRVIYTSDIQNQKFEIDISQFSSGVYVVRLNTSLGTATKKLTIAR